MDVRIEERQRLEPTELAGVRALATAAAEADGSAPLNDAAGFLLDQPARHLLAMARDRAVGDRIVGYGQLPPVDQPEPDVAQLVVDPSARREGIGTALVGALRAAGAGGAWAFGNGPGARALAARTGARPVRGLLLMGRSLTEPLPEVVEPAGIRLRTFRVGADEDAWLRVNARAFAHHPEQGAMTRADLADRESAEWFDPNGFFLAETDDPAAEVVGFHWTKAHSAELGEVYVIGVDPDHGGAGLGKALLRRGLQYLASTGRTRVILYVEAEAERVVALYTWYGFAELSRDVMYRWTR